VRTRRFGATDLLVSEIGFGCARLGGFFGSATRADMVRTLRAAAAAGVTFFDTADMYTQGESERLLGDAFRGDRGKVVIASKVGYCLPRQRVLATRLKPLLRPVVRRLGLRRSSLPGAVRGELAQDFSPAYLVRAVEGSLRRLRTDYLDLLQLHSPPTAVLERGDFLAPLEQLQRQGKVRYYGVSCERTADALLCLQHPGLAALQLRLNLLDQSALAEALPRAGARGVAVIARECYAGGLLTKPLDHLGLEAMIADAEAREAKRREVLALDRLAHRHGRALHEFALQFVLSVDHVSVALLGMRTGAHLSDNLRCLPATRLDPALLREARQALLP
jgi:aryl-alcohol dehydrogenase-like predicted oxidoreductase